MNAMQIHLQLQQIQLQLQQIQLQLHKYNYNYSKYNCNYTNTITTTQIQLNKLISFAAIGNRTEGPVLLANEVEVVLSSLVFPAGTLISTTLKSKC
jgi:hypothetical protein